MKRRLFRLGLFLLLGAIINVAVVWGCVFCLPDHGYGERVAYPDEIVPFLDEDDATRVENWSSMLDSVAIGSIERGFGARRVTCGACSGGMCVYTLICSGIPCDSLYGWRLDTSNMPPRVSFLARTEWWGTRDFPLHPLWPGFAINTMFYAAILWLPFAALGRIRRRRRIKRGLCPACAYPIRGGSSDVCTECGKPVKA